MTTRAWEVEPDEKDWEAHGLKCALRRGPMGHWCGYVAIGKDHPLFGISYNAESEKLKKLYKERMNQPIGENPSMAILLGAMCGEMKASPEVVFVVHGGITYSGVIYGADENSWWYGFDCAHAGDLTSMKLAHGYESEGDVYRDEGFATKETERLAEQLAEIAATAILGTDKE